MQAFLDIIERDLFHTHMKKLVSLSPLFTEYKYFCLFILFFNLCSTICTFFFCKFIHA